MIHKKYKISNNTIFLTGLEFDCTVRGYFCPWHWLLINLNVIRNEIEKFVLLKVNSLSIPNLRQLLDLGCVRMFLFTFSEVHGFIGLVMRTAITAEIFVFLHLTTFNSKCGIHKSIRLNYIELF